MENNKSVTAVEWLVQEMINNGLDYFIQMGNALGNTKIDSNNIGFTSFKIITYIFCGKC